MGHSAVPMILSVLGTVGTRGGLDLPDLSSAPVPGYPVYFLSGILAFNDPDAGDLFLVCEKKGA